MFINYNVRDDSKMQQHDLKLTKERFTLKSYKEITKSFNTFFTTLGQNITSFVKINDS